eukprot:108486_1
MSDRQQSQHAKYNKTPYNNPSNHSIFNHRQFQITGGDQPKTHPKSAPRGRGRTNNRGHSYVGIQRGSHSGYKKHSDINPSKQLPYYIPKERQTTKSKYRRKWVVKDNTQSNVIQIKASNSVQEYVEYAFDLFAKKTKVVCISATGRNIGKAVDCVEIIKRKHHGLHQESSIERNTIKEVWVPLEKFLKDVIIEREVIYVNILLSFDKKLVNKDHIGYQEPISWIDLGDARELHDKMKGKMNKLQNKYDLQEENFTNMKGKYNKQEIRINKQRNDYDFNMNTLQNKYDSQESALANIQHKYDEQEEMNDLRMDKLGDKYDVKQGQFEDMENKYDIQIERMKENKEQFDFLQNKYNTLQKHSNDRDENVRLKQNKYDNLNAKELVDVIVSLNEKRYQKYKDGLVKKFIEEGVDGSCLNQLTKEDLYGFGITNYKDKIAIYNAIKQLFT